MLSSLASAARLSRRAATMGQRTSVPSLGGGRRAAGHVNGAPNNNEKPPSSSSSPPPPAAAAASTTADTDTRPPPPHDLAALEAAFGQPLSTTPMAPATKPLVLVVSGPSGVGKDAVLQRLRARRPQLRFVVTATTRSRRPDEVDGVDYHFVSRAAFESWISKGDKELLEHALVYGEYKGIPRAQVDRALAAGEDVVLRLDVQGAATVRRLLRASGTPHASVFVVAESRCALARRLAARGTEDQEALRRRFREAEAEVARLGEFDYVVVNREGRLEECVDSLAGVIDAHKLRLAASAGNNHSSSGDEQK
jgi:guanylate kinase